MSRAHLLPSDPTQQICRCQIDHLTFANQTYFQHMHDALRYSWMSLKSCVYFAIHAFFPNSLQHNGSDTIVALNDELLLKYEKCIEQLMNSLD
jgi:Family of unknown function (DUF6356)